MDVFLGQIVLLPYGFTPMGFTSCEGQLLSIADNVSLFGLLDTRYGGDGVINFALPDLRGKEPVEGLRYCLAMQGSYPARPSVG